MIFESSIKFGFGEMIVKATTIFSLCSADFSSIEEGKGSNKTLPAKNDILLKTVQDSM